MVKMQTNNVVRVKFKDSKRYIFSSKPFTFQSFLECVAKKFDLPTLDVKVFDDSKTEVDEEAFRYLLTRPDLGVLEIVIPGTANIDDSLSSSSLGDTEGTSESDDTAMLIRSPPEKNQAEERRLAKMIEDILKTSPGGEKVINEYARTKGLSDARRRDMVKILVAHLTNEHGLMTGRRQAAWRRLSPHRDELLGGDRVLTGTSCLEETESLQGRAAWRRPSPYRDELLGGD
ncbi:hypothetical protein HF521_016896 [Silurus meridionalis]|uniref:Uncharacterized protein n=1 Tax=Silurus meridionalis TaxID=175797 RepID=A0A8T0BL54_SILME|nr:hypothetical protein HF521_016896 [Silurus meridionalis]